TLGALLVDVGQLSNVIPLDDKILHEQIARIKEAGESAVRSIRDMALLLRPPMLDDLGLIPALECQARETSRRCGILLEVNGKPVANSNQLRNSIAMMQPGTEIKLKTLRQDSEHDITVKLAEMPTETAMVHPVDEDSTGALEGVEVGNLTPNMAER